MVEHRMAGERPELSDDAQHHRLRVDALEPDLALAEIGLDTIQSAKEIVVPERAPEFTVGDGSKADILLLPDDACDLAILDRLQCVSGDFAFLTFRAGLFQRCGAQQATDVLGAERRTFRQRHERRLAAPYF